MEFLLKQMSRSKNNKRVLPADGAGVIVTADATTRSARRGPDRVTRTLLAVDYGERRVGLAISDPTGTIASPAGVIVRRAGKRPPVAEIVRRAEALEARGFVVGLPLDGNGDDTPRVDRSARRSRRSSTKRTGLPVELVDERYTTAAALRAIREMGGSTRGRKGDVDALAATDSSPACASRLRRSVARRAIARSLVAASARRCSAACEQHTRGAAGDASRSRRARVFATAADSLCTSAGLVRVAALLSLLRVDARATIATSRPARTRCKRRAGAASSTRFAAARGSSARRDDPRRVGALQIVPALANEARRAAGIGDAAARDTALLRELDIPTPTLEGYLFPDTYIFADGTSPRVAVREMVKRFEQVWKPEWDDRLQQLAMSGTT